MFLGDLNREKKNNQSRITWIYFDIHIKHDTPPEAFCPWSKAKQ